MCSTNSVTDEKEEIFSEGFIFVYYESIKRELKIRPIYECRCDERLQTKVKGIYTPRIHWVPRGTATGTPKDRDEVHKREDCECVRCVCDLDVIGAPSKLSRALFIINGESESYMQNLWANKGEITGAQKKCFL
jgi:hypothetical protein